MADIVNAYYYYTTQTAKCQYLRAIFTIITHRPQVFNAFRILVVPPLSVVGSKTFPKASKRDEIG